MIPQGEVTAPLSGSSTAKLQLFYTPRGSGTSDQPLPPFFVQRKQQTGGRFEHSQSWELQSPAYPDEHLREEPEGLSNSAP
ncbi:hypothetical protein GBAR_LOCUS3390 [Geodia barretti]|uniref:Uncharacterized protein n=1 Tax=Geodia barretti TaxID=519541 RepID=A0AA35W8J5_GEOBA|nr:hypothetical protein GBAR_LOCUS3390 [Geodia barretti]